MTLPHVSVVKVARAAISRCSRHQTSTAKLEPWFESAGLNLNSSWSLISFEQKSCKRGNCL